MLPITLLRISSYYILYLLCYYYTTTLHDATRNAIRTTK